MPKPKKQDPTELHIRRFQLWRKVINTGNFVRGSVTVLHRPCTREGCRRCQSGEKHPATYLSVNHKGRTKLLYLSKQLQPVARQWVLNYRELKELIEEISEVNREILGQMAKSKGGGKK